LLPRIDTLIDLALEEDAGLGDVTSRAIFPATHTSRGWIEARQGLVVCGLEVATRVFARVDPAIKVTATVEDGEWVKPGKVVLKLKGPTGSLLTAERTALNFLQRLCGIATQSRRYAEAAEPLGLRIVDTRKTTPGYRALEKYAVRCGGCHNHRFSLGEHILIKDNHIAAAGSIKQAVDAARREAPHTAKIEIEAKSLNEVRQALAAGAEVILLDNMDPARAAEAARLVAGRALLEISGGVTLETLKDYAIPGISVISVGALTHSARAADLSLELASR
jgi:nicotinate-nucleotide pyrophosphorylase (carboxylating)